MGVSWQVGPTPTLIGFLGGAVVYVAITAVAAGAILATVDDTMSVGLINGRETTTWNDLRTQPMRS